MLGKKLRKESDGTRFIGVKAAIDEALKAKKTGERKVIAFNFSGHGLLDLQGYSDYMEGVLKP